MSKWDTLSEIGQSPYLEQKKVDGFDVCFKKDVLIIPVRDVTGKLWNLITNLDEINSLDLKDEESSQ